PAVVSVGRGICSSLFQDNFFITEDKSDSGSNRSGLASEALAVRAADPRNRLGRPPRGEHAGSGARAERRGLQVTLIASLALSRAPESSTQVNSSSPLSVSSNSPGSTIRARANRRPR